MFINTPFDEQFAALSQAIVFAVIDCGLCPRSALEHDDSSETRIEKLVRLIGSSKFGIHDISRTELNSRMLPRFNMPFELGLFLGAKIFRDDKGAKRKAALILDAIPYRYQQFISDIAGQDIRYHRRTARNVIEAVRHWYVSIAVSAGKITPGATTIVKRFRRFQRRIPMICCRLQLDADALQFNELCHLIRAFLKEADAAQASSARGRNSRRLAARR